MREELKAEIKKFHARGLSVYGIEMKIHHAIPSWEIKKFLEEQIKQDMFRE